MSTKHVLPTLLLSTILLAPTAFAQGAAEAPKGTLTIAVPWDPGTMDPQMHRQRYTQIISHQMRDKLTYQKPPGLVFEPLLLESLKLVDETTYQITFRQGVKFHNGDTLTAEDIIYTYNRLADPANKSPRFNMISFSNIEKIEAVDDHTINFKVKKPFASLDDAIRNLGFNSQEIMHKASSEKLSLEDLARAPVIGVGAFKFVEWLPDQRIVMEGFADYWQGPPKLERLIWRSVPEESTRVAELLSGSVDMIYPVSADTIGQLRGAGLKIEMVAGTSTTMLQMSFREGSPFVDPDVRRAMNMAVDKAAIVQHIYQGLAVPYEMIAGVGQEGFIDGYDPFPFDPEAARPILSKLTAPIELLTSPTNELAAEFIAEQLRTLGMNISAVVLDNAAMTAKADSGDFTLLIGAAGYGSGDFQPTYGNNFLCTRLKASGQVRTWYCNEALDEKYAAYRAENDPAKRKAMLEEVTKQLTEVEMPWVPLYGPAEVWAMQPYVHGFVGSPAGQMFDLNLVSVDK